VSVFKNKECEIAKGVFRFGNPDREFHVLIGMVT
jgi:hypothetical protein